MQICAIGLHKNNTPEEVWSLAPGTEDCCRRLAALTTERETLFIVSSHAIELFAVLDGNIKEKKEQLKDAFLQTLDLRQPRAPLPFHDLEGPDAVRHFLSMALGLEPMAYDAENDFLEKTSKSIKTAGDPGGVGPVLNRLYQTALMLSAKVEQSGLSFDYSAIAEQIESLVLKIFGSFSSVGLLFVGANELSAQLQAFFAGKSMREQWYTGPGIATVPGLGIIESGDVGEVLQSAQVVLRMSRDCDERFTPAALRDTMERRNNQPLLLVNLDATIVPEASYNKIYNLFVYDLTDFQQDDTPRDSGLGITKGLIEDELKLFFAWFYSKEHYRFGEIIGKSPGIEKVLEFIARIAQTDITVLVQGESGTGKELVARAIHENSARRTKPFVSVNCGALTETLLESELFGHERGAFTGAVNAKMGLLEEADGGTLMLDEIGDTSPAFQVKLLRVLQEGEMRRVGGSHTRKIDVRIIAATNKRLDEQVARGTFRQDLYYRLNVVQIDLPPLRERAEDILLLADHFIATFAGKVKKRITGLKNESAEMLTGYSWPGNVRELENAIEHAVALSIGHTILPEDLPAHLHKKTEPQTVPVADHIHTLKELEKAHIIKALQRLDWDYGEVARILEIGRTTLWRKIKEYDIKKPSELN